MTKQSTKDYLISIAEHLLQQSCQNQAYIKYQRIKATLNKKQQKENKLLERQMSAQRLSKTKLDKWPESNVKPRSSTKNYQQKTIKRGQTLSPSMNKRSNTLEKSTSKISKHKANKFIINGSKTIDLNEGLSNRKSNSKKKYLQVSDSTGKKSSSSILRKKNLFENFNEAQQLIQTKMKGLLNKSNNKKSTQTTGKKIENHSNQTNKQQTKIIRDNNLGESFIHLNISLNKLLQKIQASLNERVILNDQNIYDRKKIESILSQENIKLLKNITKKLKIHTQLQSLSQNERLSQGFKKQKKQNKVSINSTNKKSIRKDQSQQIQNQNQSLFSFVQISTPQKSHTKKQANSPLSPLLPNNQNTQSAEFHMVHKQLQTIKKCFRQKQAKLSSKIQQLKTDNKWLVQNMENLLNQNQQLKAIIVNYR